MYPKALISGAALPVLIALLPLAYLVRLLVLHHVDVPFWDQWEMVPWLDHLSSGTLGFGELWKQHNEHRPFFPIVTMLALARVSGWNTAWEIAANLLMGAGIFSIFFAWARRAARLTSGHAYWLLPCFSVLLFSPVQWENWAWGWQITVLMGTLSAVLGTYLVSVEDGTPRFTGAVLCAVWSTYSFASGFVCWVTGPIGTAIRGGRRTPARLAAWGAAGAITMASYFYDYHRPTDQPSILSVLSSLQGLSRVTRYALTYLGAPVTGYDTGQATIAGALLVVAFSFFVFRLWPERREPAILFPCLIGLHTIGVAALSALGRVSMGVEQALTSRYTTITMPAWCAILSLAYIVAWREVDAKRALVMRGIAAAATLAILVSAVSAGRIGVNTVPGRNETLRFARRGLIVGRSDALLLMLYPNLNEIRARRATLLRLHLSVFRPSTRPAYPVPGDQ